MRFRGLRAVIFTGVILLALCSCNLRFFAGELRSIGGVYRLKRSGNPSQCAHIAPHKSGGLIIDESGWRDPVIFAGGSGSKYWDAINRKSTRLNSSLMS